MKFKVGDMVRPTREHLIDSIENDESRYLEYLNGFEITKVDGDKIHYDSGGSGFYLASDLELVPEESEFKEGDLVEIVDETGVCNKRIFVAKLPDMVKAPYVIVLKEDEDLYRNNKPYRISRYQYISKLKHKLTRKEIAEKFWVDKDFELVD